MRLATAFKTIAHMAKPSAKILVVDDDDEIRSLLQIVLTREGFDVQQAKDAPTARRMLGAQHGVDLIILYVMMPGRMASRCVKDCVKRWIRQS